MADTSDSKRPHDQARGIPAAGIEGAKERDKPQSSNPDNDDAADQLARPQPGMTGQPAPSKSSTNQYTGVTGAIRKDAPDETREPRRAESGNPDGADETLER